MKKIEWKNKIIYQIFPRSFKDSNNDGDGDLNGITDKLEYLNDLGVDAIWLCPTYDTNFEDAGYDVKDYKSVWSKFGTIEDFKKMTSKAESLGIEIILDIVLNHVSDKHEWFLKALESKENKEYNYFIWRKKPNNDEKNAVSFFGGSAWEYVKKYDEYYFHIFSKAQVDLNWEHPDTIDAMASVIDFWYDLGVKGFRMDAIKHISKSFPDGISNGYSWGPTAVKQLQKFNEVAFKNKPDAFVFGESSGIQPEEAILYGMGRQKVATSFYNFSWWSIGWGETSRNGWNPNWDFKDFAKNMSPFQSNEKIGPELMTNFLSNHDTSRAISRWGDENTFWKESAKTFALMMFILKGIPCIYYGEEIGMLNPGFTSRDEFRDVDAKNAFNIYVDKQKLYTEEELIKYMSINGRDNSRTPMQWDDSTNAGFNKGGNTWIQVGKNYREINVKKQENDPLSILSFYKEIIKLRKGKYKEILVDGSSDFNQMKNGLFKITRVNNGKKIIALINITNKIVNNVELVYSKQILTTWNDNKKFNGKIRSFESILFEGE